MKKISGKMLANTRFKRMSYFIMFFTALLLLLIVSGSIYVTPPGKVIDPSNPRFDPLTFNLHDYKTPEYRTLSDKCDLVQMVLKVGTKRSVVQEIMVDSAGSRQLHRSDNKIEYLSPRADGIRLIFGSIIPEFYSGQTFLITFDNTNRIEKVECPTLMGPFDLANIKKRIGK